MRPRPDRWRLLATPVRACPVLPLPPAPNGVRSLRSLRSYYGLLVFWGNGVRHQNEAVRASAQGGSVMITRRELGDRGGEFAAELRAIGGRAEADLGIDRE